MPLTVVQENMTFNTGLSSSESYLHYVASGDASTETRGDHAEEDESAGELLQSTHNVAERSDSNESTEDFNVVERSDDNEESTEDLPMVEGDNPLNETSIRSRVLLQELRIDVERVLWHATWLLHSTKVCTTTSQSVGIHSSSRKQCSSLTSLHFCCILLPQRKRIIAYSKLTRGSGLCFVTGVMRFPVKGQLLSRQLSRWLTLSHLNKVFLSVAVATSTVMGFLAATYLPLNQSTILPTSLAVGRSPTSIMPSTPTIWN